MKVQEIRELAMELEKKKVAQLGLGFAVQCTSIYEEFCEINKFPERFQSFTQLLHASLNNHRFSNVSPRDMIFDPQEVVETAYAFAALCVAVYCYEQRVLYVDHKQNIIKCIFNELFVVALDFSDETVSDEDIEVPAQIKEHMQVHMPLLRGTEPADDYFAHCSLMQFPTQF